MRSTNLAALAAAFALSVSCDSCSCGPEHEGCDDTQWIYPEPEPPIASGGGDAEVLGTAGTHGGTGGTQDDLDAAAEDADAGSEMDAGP